jgi:hypothetical protein
MAGSSSPMKKATAPASQEKKKAAPAKPAEGTGADIRNFVSTIPSCVCSMTDGSVLAGI